LVHVQFVQVGWAHDEGEFGLVSYLVIGEVSGSDVGKCHVVRFLGVLLCFSAVVFSDSLKELRTLLRIVNHLLICFGLFQLRKVARNLCCRLNIPKRISPIDIGISIINILMSGIRISIKLSDHIQMLTLFIILAALVLGRRLQLVLIVLGLLLTIGISFIVDVHSLVAYF